MISPRLLLALAPLCLASCVFAACVNTDPTVFVEPTIESPAATVGGGALGATLKGSFTLKLHLGPRATGPSKVTLGAFNLLDAQQKASITTVQVTSASGTAPLDVQLDSDTTAALTFDTGTKTLPADVKTKLCDPAGIVIGGVIEDSLQDHSTPFSSAVFHATCM